MSTKLCTRCVLPENYPGITFDAEGVCNTCKDFAASNIDFKQLRATVESTISALMGKAPTYDIVVAFSGGKDSTYTLKYLRDVFKARMVAITIDNDFVSDVARDNCRRVTEALAVDHIFFKPAPKAMMEIYNQSLAKDLHSVAALKRATAICNSCIQVINTQILNFATAYQIPVVAGGYLGGQIPSETGFMKQNLALTGKMREGMMTKLGTVLSSDAKRLFVQNSGAGNEIVVLNPMAYLNVSEEHILEVIPAFGWSKPKDTGKSSTNCLLNDYAIHQHMKKLSFHPYIAEIAAMVRRGTISREEGIQKSQEPVPSDHFEKVEKRLGRFS